MFWAFVAAVVVAVTLWAAGRARALLKNLKTERSLVTVQFFPFMESGPHGRWCVAVIIRNDTSHRVRLIRSWVDLEGATLDTRDSPMVLATGEGCKWVRTPQDSEWSTYFAYRSKLVSIAHVTWRDVLWRRRESDNVRNAPVVAMDWRGPFSS